MQLRVAVVGKSKIIVGDVSNRVYRGDYFVCPIFFDEPDYVFKLVRLYPHVIIICLNDENLEELVDYNDLLQYNKIDEAAIIVISHPDKYERFKNDTLLNISEFVPRPLRIEALFNALDKIKDSIKEMHIGAEGINHTGSTLSTISAKVTENIKKIDGEINLFRI